MKVKMFQIVYNVLLAVALGVVAPFITLWVVVSDEG